MHPVATQTTNPASRVSALNAPYVSGLIQMTRKTALVGLAAPSFAGLRISSAEADSTCLLAGPWHDSHALRLPSSLLVHVNDSVRILLKRCVDILVTRLAGLRPDVLRALLRTRWGPLAIPKASRTMVVLILRMGLVDRECSIRAMTNRAALSDRVRIRQRMRRSRRGDVATDA